MVKTVIVTAGFLFITNFLQAQEEIDKSTWITSPVKTDGKANDWPPFHLYDNSSKLFFAFANDAKNLYICFQSSDEINMMKIIRAGMKISLSVKTADKHKVSVSFPLAQSWNPSQKPSAENNSDQKSYQKNRRINFLAQNTMMEVKGFATKDGMIAINDSSGINAAIDWDENNKLTYEIAVPFNEFYGAGYTMEDLLKPVSIDVEVNAVTNKSHEYKGGGEGGFSGRGRGGRMGGGGGGHRRNNDTAVEEKTVDSSPLSRASMYEKGELKEKIILATGNPSK